MQYEHEEHGHQHSSWKWMAENIWEVARMLPEHEKGTETVSCFLHKLSYSHFATKAASCTDIVESTPRPDSVAPDAPDSLAFPIPVAAPVSTADSIVPVTPITPGAPTVVRMPIVVNPVGLSSPLTTFDSEDAVSNHEDTEGASKDNVKFQLGSPSPGPKRRHAQKKKAAPGEGSQ